MEKSLFGTDGIRGVFGLSPLTELELLHIGKALALSLPSRNHRVVIGCDTRSSCNVLEYYIVRGLEMCGINATFAGVLPTPAVSFLTRSMRYDFGIVISASHNTYEYNGIKVFDNNGSKIAKNIEKRIEYNFNKLNNDYAGNSGSNNSNNSSSTSYNNNSDSNNSNNSDTSSNNGNNINSCNNNSAHSNDSGNNSNDNGNNGITSNKKTNSSTKSKSITIDDDYPGRIDHNATIAHSLDHDASHAYSRFLRSTLPSGFSLHNMKIAIDTANGACAHIAPKIFSDYGATLFLTGNQPNGTNINDKCGALHPHVLQDLVLKNNADIGFAFDGDGDRLVIVDSVGNIIDGDQILAFVSDRLVHDRFVSNSDNAQRGHDQYEGGVVSTILSNLGLKRFLDSRGIPFVQSAVGDSNVALEMAKHGWKLGGEPSGHILMTHYNPTGDALLVALHVLHRVLQSNQATGQIFPVFQPVPQVSKVFRVDGYEQIRLLHSAKVQNHLEQVKSYMHDLGGSLVVRPSGTEPLIRIMVQGDDYKQVNSISDEVVSYFEQAVLAA